MIRLCLGGYPAHYAGFNLDRWKSCLRNARFAVRARENFYVCKVCGVKFWGYCGSFTEKLCIDCLQSVDEEAQGEELKPQSKMR